MKKLCFIFCCFVLNYSSYSQFDSKKYNALLDAGDSLFQIKHFKESALAYSAALQMRAGNAPLIRWETSRSWAMATERDSAFYHLETIAVSNRPSLPLYDNILTDSSFNNLHSDQRWQKFENSMISNYRNIAIASANRIRSGYWTNKTNDGYDAARAWASAGEKDSAFFYLVNIINTDYNVFIDYPRISEDNYLLLLHGDKRWQPLLDSVKKNWSWIKTAHSFTGPNIPMIATVDPESRFFKSDGKGSYKNGVEKVISVDQHAYNLQISGHTVWYQSGDRTDLSSRFVMLDLNSPVKGSGSVAQGIIKDNDFEFHVSYKMDTTVSPQIVYNFREIPVGATIESDRTEIDFYINGVYHTLTMGPWAFGRNNEAIAHKGHLNGIGTTKVKVTRHSESSYTIEAPEGSIGRLWRTQNMTKPVDMGLFKTGFIIHLQKQ
jgi:hypothetical protein